MVRQLTQRQWLPLGTGVTGLGTLVAAWSAAPWWVVLLGAALAAAQLLAGLALALAQTLVPQTSSDRRRLWEAVLARRR